MLAGLAADLVVVLHLAFIVFVVVGGLLVLRWPGVAWAHLPAVVWGIVIEWRGWICPLTPLENHLRERAGQDAYQGGFIDNYVVPLIYPPDMTPATGNMLAVFVLVVNLSIYSFVLWRRGHRRHRND